MTFYKKYLFNNLPFHIYSSIAIFMMVASLIIPPPGIIDPSVLSAVAWIFGFTSLWTVIKAIDKGVDAKFKKGDVEVNLDNPDPK